MSEELVKRLRKRGERIPVPCPDGIKGCAVSHFRVETDPTCAEAADTIEAQAAEIEELKGWEAAEDAHHHVMREVTPELMCEWAHGWREVDEADDLVGETAMLWRVAYAIHQGLIDKLRAPLGETE